MYAIGDQKQLLVLRSCRLAVTLLGHVERIGNASGNHQRPSIKYIPSLASNDIKSTTAFGVAGRRVDGHGFAGSIHNRHDKGRKETSRLVMSRRSSPTYLSLPPRLPVDERQHRPDAPYVALICESRNPLRRTNFFRIEYAERGDGFELFVGSAAFSV